MMLGHMQFGGVHLAVRLILNVRIALYFVVL